MARHVRPLASIRRDSQTRSTFHVVCPCCQGTWTRHRNTGCGRQRQAARWCRGERRCQRDAERGLSHAKSPPAEDMVPKSSAGSVATSIPSTAPKAIPSDTNKPGEVRRFKDLGWGVKSLAFSPNGGLLAAGKMDRALLLFDVVDNSQIQSLDKLEMLHSVTSCCFTPSGTKLIAGGDSGHIQIFNVSTNGLMKEAGQFPGHSQEIECISGFRATVASWFRAARKKSFAIGRSKAVVNKPSSRGFKVRIKACYIAKNGRTAIGERWGNAASVLT